MSKALNFFEAMEALKDGKKIRRESWKDNEFVGLKQTNISLFGIPKPEYMAINQDKEQGCNSVSLTTWLNSDFFIVE